MTGFAQAVPWPLMAVLSYLATLALGTLSLRGRRVGRAWHSGLFVLTSVLTVLAALLSLPDHWVRGILLSLALVPLALLPFLTVPVSRHPRRHILIGLSAAPCYLVALVLWTMDP